MRRITKNHLGLAGALLLLPLTAAHSADKKAAPSVSARWQQAFRLGYALQAPNAQTEQFLQAVKGLKTIADDAEVTAEIGKLAGQSVALRASEGRGYRQARQLLYDLSAPADLQAWAEHAAARLDAPLAVSQKDKAGSDPDTATVLGTIDEAQDIKTNGDQHMPALFSWVKLTQGGDAVWAAVLGQLTARMHTAALGGKGLALSRTDITRIRNTAPFGTPGAVLDALTELTPAAGNLASLIRLPATPIAPKELNKPQAAFLDAYAARPLAQAIDKSP